MCIGSNRSGSISVNVFIDFRLGSVGFCTGTSAETKGQEKAITKTYLLKAIVFRIRSYFRQIYVNNEESMFFPVLIFIFLSF